MKLEIKPTFDSGVVVSRTQYSRIVHLIAFDADETAPITWGKAHVLQLEVRVSSRMSDTYAAARVWSDQLGWMHLVRLDATAISEQMPDPVNFPNTDRFLSAARPATSDVLDDLQNYALRTLGRQS